MKTRASIVVCKGAFATFICRQRPQPLKMMMTMVNRYTGFRAGSPSQRRMPVDLEDDDEAASDDYYSDNYSVCNGRYQFSVVR